MIILKLNVKTAPEMSTMLSIQLIFAHASYNIDNIILTI